MDDGCVIGLEDHKLAVAVLGTVDREIIETYPLGNCSKRASVTKREILVEIAHETLFLKALVGIERHARVEIPDVPTVRDRHVARVGLAVDEDDPVLAEQAVAARIIDEGRSKE